VHVAEYLADPPEHPAVEATIVSTGWEVSAAVRELVATADVIVTGPSTPVLSVDPLLSTPGLREAMTAPVLEADHDAAALLSAAREAVGARR
jgi:2-phospho-L-lactate transferase/gluconeogenesis factor (CofD/UPF0052 family)